MKDIKKIVEAVRANRGGLTQATHSQILTIWRSLDEDTQKKYLDSVKTQTQNPK